LINPRWWSKYRADPSPGSVDRPIFILGVQGGGLTLLTRMLRRHGSVVAGAGGPGYWSSADEIQNIYGPLLPLELAGTRWKCPDHPVFSGPYSWCYGTDDMVPMYRNTAEHATDQLRRQLQSVIGASLAIHGASVNTPRFIDKSQSYVLRVSMIAKLLDGQDPRFVLLTRDPYVSVQRAAEGGAADMARLADTVELADRIRLCAEHWTNCMNAALEDRHAAPSGLLTVKFEDLVANPSRTLQEVGSHCDLEIGDHMLPQAGDTLPFGSRFRDRWYPLRPDVNDAYNNRIGAHTVRLVNELAGSTVERLGYDVRDPNDCTIEFGETDG